MHKTTFGSTKSRNNKALLEHHLYAKAAQFSYQLPLLLLTVLPLKESRMNSGLTEPKHSHSLLWPVFGRAKVKKTELTDLYVHLLHIVWNNI